ncbi:restriction endonuclease [Bacillus wiedmannii]|uniref:restriction endonuclease n=1 Tax=Bacillus wiedmannii TaxID=1890302 RepID=UPI0015CF1146|nr:restriction endonuclease [Bacillus wiedmannii]
MKILNEEPNSWRELELTVAKVLNDAGYTAYNDRQIATVRGNVNIDVLAEDRNTIPISTYLIECKHWDSDIPQTIIHSFRTVVNDYGAHHGLIIARKGFQSGAYAATKNTNIRLLSWEDFLNSFEERWLNEAIKNLYKTGQPLLIYIDPLDCSDYIDKLSNEERLKYQQLVNEYMGYAVSSHKFWYEFDVNSQKSRKEDFENVMNKIVLDHFENEQINCYYDYFELLKGKCLEGIEEFEKLLKNTGVDKYVKDLIS